MTHPDIIYAARAAITRAPSLMEKLWLEMRLGRWLGRREPTTYQRCLLTHIVNAQPRSALK
jgi:hypothetical protein